MSNFIDEQCCICLEIINYARTITLLESVCKHKFCEKCKNTLFQKQAYQECPMCRKRLFKNDFKERPLDEIEFEHDKSFRTLVLSQIGRDQSQFDSIDEYDDYLENVEDIIFQLKSDDKNIQAQGQNQIEMWKKKFNQRQQSQLTLNLQVQKQQRPFKLPQPLPYEQQSQNQSQNPQQKYIASGTTIDLYLQRSFQELLYFKQ